MMMVSNDKSGTSHNGWVLSVAPPGSTPAQKYDGVGSGAGAVVAAPPGSTPAQKYQEG
jgi:hypothetical protein